MARYVIDATTLVHIVREGIAVNPAHQLVAPNSIRSDASELLYGLVHEGELTEAQALRLHDRMTEMKMRILGDRVSRRVAWQIAREHGWDEIGDAEYLAVTKLQADALITIDDTFARKATGIVPLSALEALTRPS